MAEERIATPKEWAEYEKKNVEELFLNLHKMGFVKVKLKDGAEGFQYSGIPNLIFDPRERLNTFMLNFLLKKSIRAGEKKRSKEIKDLLDN